MCGIAGFLDRGGRTSGDAARHIARDMADALTHRGPDAGGAWATDGVGLGHRRLSILDLSDAGAQPMTSPCGRWTLCYNGEVYNHLDLRAELNDRHPHGQPFAGHSDTETLLAGCAAWGLRGTLERSNGMFAVALWDNQHRTLTLARDRMGIKPLYWGRFGDVLLFGSELKALRRHPAFRGDINRDAISLLLRHSYIPGPGSIYDNVQKLPPGTILKLSADVADTLPDPQPYWSLDDAVTRGQAEPFAGSEADAADRLEELLTDAVRLRLLSDVPVGAFLSGGIDSSIVVALMQTLRSTPARTFTIGFEEAQHDESRHARAVAQHLGTDHTELIVTPAQAREVIPRLPTLFDEPFADASQIPTFLVSQLARHDVTVSLSGDGGDELFGGYGRYAENLGRWRRLDRVPRPLRWAAGRSRGLLPAIPSGARSAVKRRLDILAAANPGALYALRHRHWQDHDRPVRGVLPCKDALDERLQRPGLPAPELWLYADALTYLPDDILVKVDRASMAVGLEARVPIIDYRVVEFAWSLPMEWKLRGKAGKRILKTVLARHVPRELFERPKMGFGVPIDDWLRGPLRDWGESLLDERRLRDEGYFNPAPIRRDWHLHQSGKADRHYHLWDVLMFQAWLEANRSS